MSKIYHPDMPVKPFKVFDNENLTHAKPEKWSEYMAALSDTDIVIVKLGTNVVTHKVPRRTAHVMHCVAEDVTALQQEYGKKVLVVSSGAIGLGRKLRARLGHKIPKEEKDSAKQKQLDAIYGQDELYRLWMNHFYPAKTSEVLITHQDVRHKDSMFKRLYQNLDKGVISIVNEDDKRSTEEIEDENRMFWDNDGLESLISQGMALDGYKVMSITLTNMPGICTRKSYRRGQKEVISVVLNSHKLERQVVDEQSPKGRGGMLTKIMAKRDAAKAGVLGVIADGMYCDHDGPYQKNSPEATRNYRVILDIMDGKFVGSWFMPEVSE
ncbi:hypothetical protein KY331_04935 [Candidatus Woesearchaeota archaeon]|nr:hypothetical protein [Candidatus Woesearchaeota archaeon]